MIQLQGCDLTSNPEVPPLPPDPGTGMWFVGSLATGGDARGVKGYIINHVQYAFLADGNNGLEIIDLTNSSTPVLTANFKTSGFAKEVYVDTINQKTYAFVSDNVKGLFIINVSNPGSPILDTLLAYVNGAQSSFSKNKNLFVAAEQNKIYSLDISFLPDSIKTLSVYNAKSSIEHIEINGQTGYLAEKSNGMEIINISNPSNMTFSSSISTSNSCNDIRITDNLAYIADGTAGISVINVGNPSQPYFVSLTETKTNVKGIDYSPNFLFTAENNDGAEVFNLFNPAYPEFVGYYVPQGYCYAVHYFKGKVLLANGQNGLLILRF